MVVAEETFFNENFKSGFQDFLTITEVFTHKRPGKYKANRWAYATNEVTQLVTGCESSKFFHHLICWNHFLK